MRKKILILGGNSFLGSHLIQDIQEDYEVTGTYLTRHPKVEGWNFQRCNLLSKADLHSLGTFDTVVVYSSIVAGNEKLERNLSMVDNAVTYCNNTSAQLIYISSSQVHFEQISNYQESKLRSEEIIAEKSIAYCIVRPAAPYGARPGIPTNREQPFHVLTEFVRKFPIVPVIGNGRYLRQPVHVKNLNSLIVSAVKSPVPEGVFEIGGPSQWVFRDIVDLIASKMGKNILQIPLPLPLCKVASQLTNFIDADLVNSVISDESVDNSTWEKYYTINLIPFEEGVKDLIQ